MNTNAGTGDHHVYKIILPNNDSMPLSPQKHYIGVDGVSWFLNKENNWFNKKMASGTLEITLSSGMEKYQTALGTFELQGGSRIAPVFDRPLLLDRNYRGGGIGFNASLTAIKKDTVLASVLKSAANASLGIVAGMVDTASIAGPTQLLTAAGGQLIEGVREILSNNSDRHEPIFDSNGLEFNITADKIIGKEMFLLFHRGADLNEELLDVRTEGQTTLPTYNGNDLEDGAWLLLRIKRSDEYPNVRPWFTKRTELKAKVRILVDNVTNGFQSKESALKEFQFSDSGEGTILDHFSTLRSIILNDGVITEVQALAFTSEITNLVVSARKSINESNKDIFVSSQKGMLDLLEGTSNDSKFDLLIADQITAIENTRNKSLINGSSNLNLDSIKNISHRMPLTMNELNKD